MTFDQVPAFNHSGVLPPFGGDATDNAHRSPYKVTMPYLVTRFGGNPVRKELLRGLVEYRKALFDGGFRSGFQWIDGSFTEHAETTRGRAPGDVDMVTLFHRPLRFQTNPNLWKTEVPQLFATFFNRETCRTTYKCDSFPIDLDNKNPQGIVEDVTYWFSLFSHQKVTNIWKGLLQINLIQSSEEYANELQLLSLGSS